MIRTAVLYYVQHILSSTSQPLEETAVEPYIVVADGIDTYVVPGSNKDTCGT